MVPSRPRRRPLRTGSLPRHARPRRRVRAAPPPPSLTSTSPTKCCDRKHRRRLPTRLPARPRVRGRSLPSLRGLRGLRGLRDLRVQFLMNFDFATAGRIVFGAGTFAKLPDIAREFGRRPLVVTGKTARRSIPGASWAVEGEPTWAWSIEPLQRNPRRGSASRLLGWGGSGVLSMFRSRRRRRVPHLDRGLSHRVRRERAANRRGGGVVQELRSG